MFKLPEDVEIELKKKYPDVPIKNFINSLFQLIINKSTQDGSCSIREFGKFISFVTKSSRIGKDVIRFKFKVTPALNDKIKYDEYLIKNLPVKAKNLFNKKNEENCLLKKEQRDANFIAQKYASILGKERTIEKVKQEEIDQVIPGSIKVGTKLKIHSDGSLSTI